MSKKPTHHPSQKVPPHDQEAERSVLGACLLDGTVVMEISTFLVANDFYYPEHSLIWEAILKLFEKRQPIDAITVSGLLGMAYEQNILTKEYVSDLYNATPNSAFATHYAHTVKGHSVRRRLIASASRLVEKGFDTEEEIEKIIDEAEGEIFQISQSFITSDFIELKTALVESFNDLETLRAQGGGVRGVHTGFHDLDNILAGLQKSNLVILAARPGIGKTSLALNIALNAALNEKIAVGVFSLEMSYKELVDRLLVSTADIEGWRMKTGRVTAEDMDKLTEAMGYLSEAPIMIDDKPGNSIMEIRSKARKLKMEKNLGLIIVDYLQLITPGKRFENRVQEVTYISQSLKNLARELKVPVIALSQLSRQVEQRGERKPQLADLRESGSIEQDADVVMFIYQEKSPDELLDSSNRPMKLSIAKHRNGALGEIDLMFRADRVKFFSMEKSSRDL